MKSFCGEIHIILTNKKEGNVLPLKRRVNKTQLLFVFLPTHNITKNKILNYFVGNFRFNEHNISGVM
ncbi:hypothetical protein RHMOL_Rhmol04G0267300 [Rhododendron molle]|uniref:Uncharacterized protein n=1 Tax=Rhododendron molle TaxID=49168 RepID=A0ACC0P4U3_RHOML|nr:hypothetical protein RHMOL_Rhmol04G0267300 [Rhododendron molle]